MYDIRFYDTKPNQGCGLFSWPPYLDEMKKYLARTDVKTALHVPIPKVSTIGSIGVDQWI